MVYVDDVVSANIHCMEYAERFDGQVFDVGTGDNISLNQVREVVQVYHDVEFDYVDPRPGEVATTCADISLLEKYGWTAAVTIPEGMHKCFNFVKPKE